MLNDITIVKCEVMSHLVRLRGKDTVQRAHCAMEQLCLLSKGEFQGGFVVLILNSQPNLLLPFRGRSFLCPPILSYLANVDLVDDQPSN